MSTGVSPITRFTSSIVSILRKYVFSTYRGLFGFTTILTFTLLGIIAPFKAPYDPNALVASPYTPPSNEFIMGTDYFGRDLFSRLLVGTTYTLLVAALASTIIVLIGLLAGALSGYFGGLVDEIFMRLTDLFMVIPSFFILIILSAYLPPNNYLSAVILGVLAWPTSARIIRSQVLSLKTQLYIEAAKAIGAGDLRIIFRHILPNMLPLVIITFIQDLVYAVHAITTLIFLGLGDIKQPTWGETLYWSFATGALYRGAWWSILYPSVFIVVFSAGLIMLNESISTALKRERLGEQK